MIHAVNVRAPAPRTLPECSLEPHGTRDALVLPFIMQIWDEIIQIRAPSSATGGRYGTKSSRPAAHTSGVNGGNEPTKRQRRGVAGRRCQTAARRRPASPLSLPRSANRRLRPIRSLLWEFLAFLFVVLHYPGNSSCQSVARSHRLVGFVQLRRRPIKTRPTSHRALWWPIFSFRRTGHAAGM